MPKQGLPSLIESRISCGVEFGIRSLDSTVLESARGGIDGCKNSQLLHENGT